MKCPLGVHGVVPAELGGLELEPVLDILNLCVLCERSTPFTGAVVLAFIADITDDVVMVEEPPDIRRSRLRCLRCLRSSSFFATPGW